MSRSKEKNKRSAELELVWKLQIEVNAATVDATSKDSEGPRPKSNSRLLDEWDSPTKVRAASDLGASGVHVCLVQVDEQACARMNGRRLLSMAHFGNR